MKGPTAWWPVTLAAGLAAGYVAAVLWPLELSVRPLGPQDLAAILLRNYTLYLVVLAFYRAGLRPILPAFLLLNAAFAGYIAANAPTAPLALFTTALASGELSAAALLATSPLSTLHAALAGLAAYALLALAEVWGYGILAVGAPRPTA